MPDHLDGLAFHELLAWTAGENERWHRWFAAHADLLDLPYAEPPLGTVRALIGHIAFVEHRYAAILSGRTPPASGGGERDDVDTVFAYLAAGRHELARAIAGTAEGTLERTIDFMTLTAGPQRASARKVVAHALMHGIRHWAQLATVLREQGHRSDWSHDLLLSDALH
jgi:uncharacterized damage-inducible protein DinB